MLGLRKVIKDTEIEQQMQGVTKMNFKAILMPLDVLKKIN